MSAGSEGGATKGAVDVREDILIIREKDTQDTAARRAIRSIYVAAFGRQDEADLVDRLRSEMAILLSLAAELDNRIVGHAVFSRAVVETDGDGLGAAALAPIAVERSRPRPGIGTRLVEEGLSALRARGEKIVIVLGHPNYYPGFGFSKEKAEWIESPFFARRVHGLGATGRCAQRGERKDHISRRIWTARALYQKLVGQRFGFLSAF